MSASIETNPKKHALNSDGEESEDDWAGPKLSEINQEKESVEPEPEAKKRKSKIKFNQKDLKTNRNLIINNK